MLRKAVSPSAIPAGYPQGCLQRIALDGYTVVAIQSSKSSLVWKLVNVANASTAQNEQIGGKPVLVLIDESGDPGFKLVRKSSSHFVIAMVTFQDLAEAERASEAITKARERLGVKPEFKFSKTRDQFRDGFFEAVCPMKFKVRALVVDKSVVYSDRLRSDTDCFYNFFVRKLLENDSGTLKSASVKLDGSGSREFQRELGAYLRKQLRDGQIREFKFKDSKSDNLVQLADMCAGAIQRASRTDDCQNDRWLRMLRKAGRVENIWPFR